MGVRVHQGGDGSRVDGSVCLIHLECLQVGDVPEACGGVLTGGDDHHAIVTQLHVLDLFGVLLSNLNLWVMRGAGGGGYFGC